ncbi:hypothetical protein PSACC_00637 [Paramicrosporidium saccamoebae]|uniref:Mediator complex subunit 8 n=1 Tax=Paramicrosporidium saccamoebae TaxID=1246581 RepID=A0A2H9TP81_9FUNG|nr:hypothetical protein PSACC_00637 [Paramicrosporidium saccamoebae]
MDLLRRTAEAGPTKPLRDKVGRITDIFEALLLSPPPVEQWPEWTSRLAALMSQYENALRELRPLLCRYLLVPNQLGTNTEFVTNVLLRTRMAPEVEAHLEELKTEEETGNVMRAISQILQEGADGLKSPLRNTMATPITQDEELITAIRTHYTAVK